MTFRSSLRSICFYEIGQSIYAYHQQIHKDFALFFKRWRWRFAIATSAKRQLFKPFVRPPRSLRPIGPSRSQRRQGRFPSACRADWGRSPRRGTSTRRRNQRGPRRSERGLDLGGPLEGPPRCLPFGEGLSLVSPPRARLFGLMSGLASVWPLTLVIPFASLGFMS